MKKIKKEYSSIISIGMCMLSIAMFLTVAILFSSCEKAPKTESERSREMYYSVEREFLGIDNGHIITFVHEDRRYTIWEGNRTSQLLHIQDFKKDEQ
jgi:hypothetical protein